MIGADPPGAVALRREVRRDHERRAPERWERAGVRFRHNTLDPDDVDDILFIEFIEFIDEPRRRGQGRS